MSNWMWIVVLLAAAAHALRWVAPEAAARALKLPAAFAVLYVVYAILLARAGLAGMIVGMIIVEIVLQLVRRSRRPPRPQR